MDNRRAIVMMVSAMVLLTLMDAVSKKLVDTYPAVQIALARYLVTLPAAYFLAWRETLKLMPIPKAPALQVLRGAIITIEFLCVVLAFAYLPLADGHAILASAPLIVVALSIPLLGERTGRRGGLAILAGLIGVLIILRPGFAVSNPGTWLALLAAFLYASFQVLTRLGARQDGTGTAYLTQILIGIAITLPLSALNWVAPQGLDWAALLAVGVLGGTAHLLLIEAFTLAPAPSLQPFAYVQLVTAIALGAIVFGELPDLWIWIGGLLVVLAGIDRFRAAK